MEDTFQAGLEFGRSRHWLIVCAKIAAILMNEDLAGGEIGFNRDIRPLLSDRCFHCHGPDSASRKAKLRLDDPASAYQARDGSFAIAPGKPEESRVVSRIFSSDPDEVMPPAESHLSLTGAEKTLIKEWIAQGGKYEPHWAFIPPAAAASPKVKRSAWVRDEIDRFVLALLEQEGIEPSPEADKARWLRRVTYDLTGLPPTPEEATAFLEDASGKAQESVVDRLLASPAFGERMAVPWLDAARYADSYGYQSDLLSPAWPYRDWVVRAFNRNLPYDRFITEQLAGDLLPQSNREQRLATAFNRLHRQTNEGGSIEEEWRLEYVADRVHTFGSVFLGLTFECARCHDHKFDPISQRDYYSLGAFFNSIDEHGTYDNTPRVPTPSMLLPNATQEAAILATAGERTQRGYDLKRAVENSKPGFRSWLETANREPIIPGLLAHFSFDLAQTNRFANEAAPTNFTGPLNGNTLVPGKAGQAIKFTGDDVLKIPGVLREVDAWTPYSLVFWMQIPSALTSAVVFHCTEGSDTSYHGTELSIQNGRLFFVVKRFWPGNAIAVQTTTPIENEKWIQIAVSNDGSGDANGLRIFVDGKASSLDILRNNLSKSPENRDFTLNFGERSRSQGLKGALFDDLRVYDRALAEIEIAQLFDGRSLRDALAAKDVPLLKGYYLAAISNPVAKARQAQNVAVRRFLEARNPLQEVSVMEEMSAPRDTYVLARGAYDAPKSSATRVSRATPSFLLPMAEALPRNRLGLANWLTDPKNPLTARVAVNRFWQICFGRGLVATADNLGSQGARPTHPELLDRLARDFMESGWDTKRLLKRIVLSATYKQDSLLRPELKQKDPENILLARGPSQRLSAEMIRDTALAASGLLESNRGGPPVSPYAPGDLWRESNSMSPAYKQSVGTDLYRRSLYTVWKRTAPMPNITAFDAPSREVCAVKRTTTTTPQQAYVLLNDPQFVEAARVLAQKTLCEVDAQPQNRIRHAFVHLTGRPPGADEIRLLTELLSTQRDIFRGEPQRAAALIFCGAQKPDASMNPIELGAYTAVVQAIMNLDATIWKR